MKPFLRGVAIAVMAITAFGAYMLPVKRCNRIRFRRNHCSPFIR